MYSVEVETWALSGRGADAFCQLMIDRDAVLLVEELVEHLTEVEQLAMIDADRQRAPGLEHRLHHLQARQHEAHPLGVARAIVAADPVAEPDVVRVVLPAVVVAPVVARVVGRVGEDQIDMAALSIQRRHRLEVVALDEEVARLLLGRPRGVRLQRPQRSRADATRESARVPLACEADLDPASHLALDDLDELFAGKIVEVLTPY